MSGGEFDWGGRLRKGIGGAQRFPQNGWKPFAECKGRRELDCDTDGWNRYESRFPTILREPLSASDTLSEATAPVKLPA